MKIRTWIAVLLGIFVMALPVYAEDTAGDETGVEAAGDQATPPVETEPVPPAAPDEAGSEDDSE